MFPKSARRHVMLTSPSGILQKRFFHLLRTYKSEMASEKHQGSADEYGKSSKFGRAAHLKKDKILETGVRWAARRRHCYKLARSSEKGVIVRLQTLVMSKTYLCDRRGNDKAIPTYFVSPDLT